MKLRTALLVTSALASVMMLSACSQQTVKHGYNIETPLRQQQLGEVRHEGFRVIETGEKLRIILPEDEFFTPGGTDLRMDKKAKLSELAETIASFGEVPIRVNGYTDNTGTLTQRKQRSLALARTVAAYLWNEGVPTAQVTVKGYGSRGSVASNTTPTGAAANRRVEILVD